MADNGKSRATVQNKVQKNVTKKVKSKAKRKAKRKVKKIHPATFVIAFLCLFIGIGAGIGAYKFISRDDCFRIKGEKSYTVTVGTPITYNDEGVKIIEFGKDISRQVKVETNLTEIRDGEYTADTSKPGEYYIIYTVDSPKYGNIQRVRTISVKGE